RGGAPNGGAGGRRGPAGGARPRAGAPPPPAGAAPPAGPGPARVHLATLAAALLTALVPAVAGAAAALRAGRSARVDPATVAVAGHAATAACLLLGLAVGALSCRPVLADRTYGLLAALGGAVAVLLLPASPGRTVVRELVRSARDGRVDLATAVLPSLAVSVLLAAAAVAAATAAAARHGDR
ncbi:hypothetical protein, partial [Kitasatospora sp. NPDC059571]|uniref:hypothetical protein n=1 Tax=Kitasatospora sp. NPDC059571 TaxID=3346871 RepID=UPI00368F1DE9